MLVAGNDRESIVQPARLDVGQGDRGEELPRIGVLGRSENAGDRTVFDDLALVKDRDIVAKHGETNDELNHPSLSRLFLADVPHVERGFGIVTSTNGRAVVAEDHPHTLGAYNMTPEAQHIYAQADLMIVVGSRLRGNETMNNKMALPPLIQIDADLTQAGRNYPVEMFVAADARCALDGLLARLPAALDTDPTFLAEIAAYTSQLDALQRSIFLNHVRELAAGRRRSA